MKKNLFRNLLLIPVAVVPLIFVPGIALGYLLPKVILFIIGLDGLLLFWLWKNRKNNQFDNAPFFANRLGFALTLFFIIQFIASVLSVSPWKSFLGDPVRMSGTVFLLHFILLVWFSTKILTEESDWMFIWKGSILASAAVMLIGFIQYAVYLFTTGNFGYISTIGNEGNLAQYLLLNFFLTLWVYKREKNPLWKKIWMVIAAMGIVSIIMTRGRGALLGLLVGGSIILLMEWILPTMRKKISFRFSKKYLFVGFAAVLLIVSGLFYFRHELKNSPAGFMFFSKLQSNTLQARAIIMKTALEGIKEHPLFGWGPENFNLVFNKHYDPKIYVYSPGETWFDRVHNAPLEIAVGSGLLGLLAWLFLWLIIARCAKNDARLFGLTTGMFAAFLFIPEDFSTLVLFYLFLGFLIFQHKNDRIKIPVLHIPRVVQNTIFAIVATTSILYFSIYTVAALDMERATAVHLPNLEFPRFLKQFNKGYKRAFINPYLRVEEILLAIRNFESIAAGKSISGIPEIFFISLTEKLQRQIEKLPPEDVRPLYLLGNLAETWSTADSSRAELAQYFLTKGLSVNPQRQIFYTTLALSYFNLPDSISQEAGLKYLRQAAYIAEEAPMGHWLLGQAYLSKGRRAEASEELAKALHYKLPLMSNDIHQNVENVLNEYQKYEALEEYFGQAILFFPKEEQYRTKLAEIRVRLSETTK